MAKKATRESDSTALTPRELAALNLLIEEMKENAAAGTGPTAAAIPGAVKKIVDKVKDVIQNEKVRERVKDALKEAAKIVTAELVTRTIAMGSVARADAASLEESKKVLNSIDKEPTLEELVALRDRLTKKK